MLIADKKSDGSYTSGTFVEESKLILRVLTGRMKNWRRRSICNKQGSENSIVSVGYFIFKVLIQISPTFKERRENSREYR